MQQGSIFAGSSLPRNHAEVARLSARQLKFRASDIGFDPGDDDESPGSHRLVGRVLLEGTLTPVPEPATLLLVNRRTPFPTHLPILATGQPERLDRTNRPDA